MGKLPTVDEDRRVFFWLNYFATNVEFTKTIIQEKSRLLQKWHQ
jgi:hypothetical protein